MKYIISLLGFVSILMTQSFTACDQTAAPTITNPDFLLNCWIHVHEEVVEEGRYFQPCDLSTLPPSRLRATYDFQANGVCTYAVLAPNDAHYSLTGTWEYDPENAHVKIYDADQVLVADFEVLELTEDRLIINP